MFLVNFHEGCKACVYMNIFCMWMSSSSAIYWRDYLCSIALLCSFVKIQFLSVCFEAVSSVSFICCLFFHQFRVVLITMLYHKSWGWVASVLQLRSSSSILCCYILGLLPLNINFRISLLISTKDLVEILIRITSNQAGKNWLLDNIEFSMNTKYFSIYLILLWFCSLGFIIFLMLILYIVC